jgi:hypothetical protein
MRDPLFNNTMYDYSSATSTHATTNVEQTGIWSNLSSANYVRIVTTKAITVRFNDVTYPAIPMIANEVRVRDDIKVSKIFITNAHISDDATVSFELHS